MTLAHFANRGSLNIHAPDLKPTYGHAALPARTTYAFPAERSFFHSVIYSRTVLNFWGMNVSAIFNAASSMDLNLCMCSSHHLNTLFLSQ